MLTRKKISPSDSPKSYSMFLSPITVQESYLTGFLTTLPLLVVVTVTAGALVETPEAGTETMSLDLVARTLVDSGWMTEELVGTSATDFLVGGTSEAGFLVGTSGAATLPLGTSPFGCCCCARSVEDSTNGALRKKEQEKNTMYRSRNKQSWRSWDQSFGSPTKQSLSGRASNPLSRSVSIIQLRQIWICSCKTGFLHDILMFC